MNESTKSVLTIPDVCADLQVSRRTVLYWIAGGKLQAFKLGGGRLWRIRKRDLRRFLANSTAGAKGGHNERIQERA